MTRSFQVTVGTLATPLVAPDWVNGLALPAAAQTAAYTVAANMLGVMTPYNAAAGGLATIPPGLTPVIGASLLFGQVGVGAVTVAPGSGVTLSGQLVTLGPNHVLRLEQTALNVWVGRTYSWNLPQFLGNPNGQPLLVSYGQIIFSNPSAAPMLLSNSPALAWGGAGTSIVAAGSFTKYYGHGPAEVWYGVVQTTPAAIGITTGPPQP